MSGTSDFLVFVVLEGGCMVRLDQVSHITPRVIPCDNGPCDVHLVNGSVVFSGENTTATAQRLKLALRVAR